MTDRDRGAFDSPRVSLLAVIAAAVLLLAGCGDFKRAIGIDRTPPDEFAVESRAPLTIPPDFDLRPPQPGAARPQEVTAAAKARQAIDSAGPGEPGKQASFALGSAQGVGGRAELPDPNQQVGEQSLAGKLLGYGAGGGTVEKRQTTILKDVY